MAGDTIYTQFLADLANGTEQWDDSSTYRVALLGSTTTYSTNKDHKTFADVTTNGGVESNASGYTRQTLAGRSVVQVDGSDLVQLRASDVAFGDLNGDTIKTILVLKRVGASDASTDRLVCAFDSASAGLPVICNGGPISITWNANGLMTLAQAAT